MPKAEPDASDRRSFHERIAADLRDDIMSGELPPGSKLPSTTHLKTRFDASNATVQKALQLLKGEGLVVGRAGAAVTVREHRQRTMRPAAFMAPAVPGSPTAGSPKRPSTARVPAVTCWMWSSAVRPPTSVRPSVYLRAAWRCSAASCSSSTTSPLNLCGRTTRWTSSEIRR